MYLSHENITLSVPFIGHSVMNYVRVNTAASYTDKCVFASWALSAFFSLLRRVDS